MEEAIFIKNINDISKVPENYKRIYYGEEFCENRLQSTKDFNNFYNAIRENGKELTIVFPYVTDKGLSKVKAILADLNNLSPEFEVVANDWGTIHYIRKKYPKAKIIAGRLLNKIKRDPRIKAAEAMLPKELYQSYKASNLLTKSSIDLLKSLGINNIEFDCPLQEVNLIESDLNYAVHYPFGYITTTRLCIKNTSTYNNGHDYSCQDRGCEYTTLEYKNKSFPCRVFQKGNTVFYYNTIAKEDLINLGFKRIIEHKEL